LRNWNCGRGEKIKKIEYKGFVIETEGFAPAANIPGSIAKVLATKNGETAVFAFAVGILEKAKTEISKQELTKMAIDKVQKVIDSGRWKPQAEYTFELVDRQFLAVKYPKWWGPVKQRS